MQTEAEEEEGEGDAGDADGRHDDEGVVVEVHQYRFDGVLVVRDLPV